MSYESDEAKAKAVLERIMEIIAIPAIVIGVLVTGILYGLETWQETQDPVQVIAKGTCGGVAGGVIGCAYGFPTGYLIGCIVVGLYRTLVTGFAFYSVSICSAVGLVGAFFVSGLSGDTSELANYLMWGGGVGAGIGVIGSIIAGHPRP